MTSKKYATTYMKIRHYIHNENRNMYDDIRSMYYENRNMNDDNRNMDHENRSMYYENRNLNDDTPHFV
jgi:hypothetical protein